MKTLIAILIVLFAMSVGAMETPAEEKAPEIKGKCPKTEIVGDADDCLKCHIAGSFAIKETKRNATRTFPNYSMDVFVDDQGEYGYFLLIEIDADGVKEFFDYLYHSKIKRATIEIFSPGGSLFSAWRIVGIMNMAKSKGMIVETRCHGFAASSGFLIFISGSMGHRLISPQSEIMWHELSIGSYLKIETPTSSEAEAEILRHLQNTANEYIAGRCNLSKKELDLRVKNKEFWLNGKEAYRDGFADRLLESKQERRHVGGRQ